LTRIFTNTLCQVVLSLLYFRANTFSMSFQLCGWRRSINPCMHMSCQLT